MYIQQAMITMNQANGTFWHSDNDWNVLFLHSLPSVHFPTVHVLRFSLTFGNKQSREASLVKDYSNRTKEWAGHGYPINPIVNKADLYYSPKRTPLFPAAADRMRTGNPPMDYTSAACEARVNQPSRRGDPRGLALQCRWGRESAPGQLMRNKNGPFWLEYWIVPSGSSSHLQQISVEHIPEQIVCRQRRIVLFTAADTQIYNSTLNSKPNSQHHTHNHPLKTLRQTQPKLRY